MKSLRSRVLWVLVVIAAVYLATPIRASAAAPEDPAPSSDSPEEPSGPVVVRAQRSPLPLGVGVLLVVSLVAGAPLWGPALRWGLILPLFSRLGRDALLESHQRSRILELLGAQPGLGIKDIARRLTIGWGTAVHHLERLEHAGLVASQDAGRHRRFFLPSVPPHERTAICALSTDLNRRILEYVRTHPGCSQTEACRALGLSAPLVHKYAQRLIADGILTSRRQWRTVQYFVAEPVAHHMEASSRTEETQGLVGPGGAA